MKPKLTPPGTNCLKLKCDMLLSNTAFKFNLRRYNQATFDAGIQTVLRSVKFAYSTREVGRCRSPASNPT